MKFLIAGYGSIGRRHLRNLRELGENDLVLMRSHKSTLPDDEVKDVPVETDIEAALAHKPDGVIIANPTALHLDIAIAGLAKDDRHRTNELLFGFPPVVIGMKTDSELFHVLTQIQDEVHRYAITFHRDRRSKHALHSELDDIKGVGPKTKEILIKALKSVKNIREASLPQLQQLVGPAKAQVIFDHFKK